MLSINTKLPYQTISALLITTALALSTTATAGKYDGLGRPATPAEIKAWDIDVRPDFLGLPPGSGSVDKGNELWDAKCSSCHGSFGEANSVFTPLVGGTTKADTLTGHVASLKGDKQPQRTTFMKVATLSTIWDYIHRAMPWNAPRSLSPDEVYSLTAYLLNLAEVVPADFVLSDKNIREVQAKMPNRNGMTTDHGIWRPNGKPDTNNVACMKNCPTEVRQTSALPDYAKNQHGNLLEQNREYGSIRGQNTAGSKSGENTVAKALDGNALLNKNGCMVCHQVRNKVVGPSFIDIAKKYPLQDGHVKTLISKVKNGGAGVWGDIPMPPNALPEADIETMVRYILNLK